MNQAIRLSVLMPVHNNAYYLSDAVESILSQTHEDFEFIIIDDYSTDDSLHILHRYAEQDSRIQLIRNPKNLGVAKTLNRGIELACGEYIARMDADDKALPKRFETQIKFLDENLDIGVLGTQTLFIDEKGDLSPQLEWNKPTSHNILLWHLLYSTPICHPSVMMRTKCIRMVGGYNPNYRNEDMHLWTRLAFITKLTNLDETLLYYRMPLDKHVRKWAYWESHIQLVSHQYIEKIIGTSVNKELIQIFFTFQKYRGYVQENWPLPKIFELCTLLEDIFEAMTDKQLFNTNNIGAVEELKYKHIQELVSYAFQGGTH